MNGPAQLHSTLWRSKPVRRAYWSARRALHVPTTQQNEILYRIHCRSLARNGRDGHFKFPWGKMEFLDATDLRTQFEQIFLRRRYAFETSEEHPVIVDCGGNIGPSALWFKLHHPGCRLTVYEADALTAKMLRRNLERAGITDVPVHAKATWTENKPVRFGARGIDRGTIDERGNIHVPAIDLAAALPWRVDLLKLDIEGAEFAVLNHLCASGAIQKVRRVIVAFHVDRDKMDEFLLLLQRLRTCGLKLGMGTASVTSEMGTSLTEAPFEALGCGASLVVVYAWKEGRK